MVAVFRSDDEDKNEMNDDDGEEYHKHDGHFDEDEVCYFIYSNLVKHKYCNQKRLSNSQVG